MSDTCIDPVEKVGMERILFDGVVDPMYLL